MPKSWVFDYQREPGGYLYPAAILHVQGKNKTWQGFLMFVDSGTDTTLLTREDALLLGIDYRSGKYTQVGGINRGFIDGYAHKLKVRLCDQEFKAEIIFADSDETPRLLGRQDIFKKFQVCFRDSKHQSYFTLEPID